ncbi:hypothetical protein [Acinetobacter sp.]|uniref:hypothetical protein n=1 Tax=Acinetobacter sp. TaxID=472 RepID=UPI00388F7D38
MIEMITDQNFDSIRKDASFYCLDHIENSMIPNTTLYGIIQKLKNKQKFSLTANERSHLTLIKLHSLIKFINGEISFNQYKKDAASNEARNKTLLEQKNRQELLEKRAIERKKRQEKLVQERRAREKAEDEQKKIEIDKSLILKAKVSKDDLETFQNKLLSLCKQYFFDPLKSELLISSRLKEILKKYEEKQSLSKFEEVYIHEYILRSLSGFLPEFQKKIRHKVELERVAEEKIRQEKLRQEAIEEQKLLELDQIYIAKQKEKALLKKYDINEYSSGALPTELSEILNKLENEIRLSQDEAVWLNTVGEKFFSTKVRHKFHRLEANYYLQEYAKNAKNIWNAINASSQLRKCQESLEAEEFLEKISLNSIKDKKLLSAYFTTLGGVRRDLHKVKVAIDNASKAHNLTPDNYRPCTLLGAIYMETYQYTLGHEWYEKASERGATNQSINADLKSIISKMDKAKRNEMIEHLLSLDPHAYSWLRSLKTAVVNKPTSKQNKVEQSVKAQKKASPSQPKNSEKSSQNLLEQGAKAHNLKQPVNLSKSSCMKPKNK